MRDQVIQGLTDGNAADGLSNAIRQAGEPLAAHFPIALDDRNELLLID